MEVNRPKLIAGLGNPSKKYETTYHNAGFLFVDYLAKKYDLNWKKTKSFEYIKTSGKIIIKTSVFMNESGKAVIEATKYFSSKGGSASGGKLKPEQIIVAHDDSDIELGKYKLQFDRSSAGHKGVESVIKTLKTQKFWRLRIGIGKFISADRNSDARRGRSSDINRRRKAGDLVLKKISTEDLKKLNGVFEKAVSEVNSY